MENRYEKLKTLIAEFVEKCDNLGFDVLGGNEVESLVLEVIHRD